MINSKIYADLSVHLFPRAIRREVPTHSSFKQRLPLCVGSWGMVRGVYMCCCPFSVAIEVVRVEGRKDLYCIWEYLLSDISFG